MKKQLSGKEYYAIDPKIVKYFYEIRMAQAKFLYSKKPKIQGD